MWVDHAPNQTVKNGTKGCDGMAPADRCCLPSFPEMAEMQFPPQVISNLVTST